jgi:hypothetical protein
MMESKNTKSEEHVSRMGDKMNTYRILVGKYHIEVGGRIISNWILGNRMGWYGYIGDTIMFAKLWTESQNFNVDRKK